ncbi:Ground-like domain protein [Aphelenchoides bicaudatus]|nr:Ground-like domain protein [Aphelenchoides bicaudatus]
MTQILQKSRAKPLGCAGHLWNVQKDDDNRETCNSIRLKVLIENSIVAADAEQSKRIIQTRTEAEYGQFYNVICGSGFFSYIAHTDEFCLASKDDMNCYVFSPVCTENLGISNGLLQRNRRLLDLRRKALKMNLKRQKKAYVNRN